MYVEISISDPSSVLAAVNRREALMAKRQLSVATVTIGESYRSAFAPRSRFAKTVNLWVEYDRQLNVTI